MKAFPKVRELFERIEADGKRIALASSAKAEELANYKRIAGIEDLLDAETSSDDADRSKPHPDIFHAALDRLGGIDPAEVIAVGDTPYDAQAAGKARLRTVGLLCGGWPEGSSSRPGASPSTAIRPTSSSSMTGPRWPMAGRALSARSRTRAIPRSRSRKWYLDLRRFR